MRVWGEIGEKYSFLCCCLAGGVLGGRNAHKSSDHKGSQRITNASAAFPSHNSQRNIGRDFSITSGGCSPTSHLCKHKFNHSTATHRPQGFLTRSIPGDWMLRTTESFRLETTSEVVECNPALPRPPLTHGPNHEEKEISLLKGQIN